MMATAVSSKTHKFLKSLDEAVSREFKGFARALVDPDSKLASAWDLGLGVGIHVLPGSGKIFVSRSDMVHRMNEDNEQVQVGRNHSDDLTIRMVIEKANSYFQGNELKVSNHQENIKALKRELGALKIPGGVKVSRNPENGGYSFELKLSYCGQTPGAIKEAVRAAKTLIKALK